MMTNISGLIRYPRRAETLIEMMFAISIGSLVVMGAMFLTIFAARTFRTLNTQMGGQSPAARTMQSVSMKLRNAKQSTIQVYLNGSAISTGEGDRIDFQSLEQTPGVTSRFQFSPSTGYLTYYPNISNAGTFDQRKGFQTLTFADLGQMIEVKTSFKYPRYAGYNQTDPEKLSGIFQTQIYPRNP